MIPEIRCRAVVANDLEPVFPLLHRPLIVVDALRTDIPDEQERCGQQKSEKVSKILAITMKNITCKSENVLPGTRCDVYTVLSQGRLAPRRHVDQFDGGTGVCRALGSIGRLGSQVFHLVLSLLELCVKFSDALLKMPPMLHLVDELVLVRRLRRRSLPVVTIFLCYKDKKSQIKTTKIMAITMQTSHKTSKSWQQRCKTHLALAEDCR